MKTTVVGNYPKIGPGTRAPNLRAAITRADQGRISREELRRIEDEVTREALEEQAQAGVDLVTDGHIRREDEQTYFASRIGGFSINGLIRYFDTNTYYRQPVAEGKLEWRGPISVADYKFAAANSARPVKVAMPGPYTLARLSRWPHYQALRDVVLDLAHVLNQEARALAEAGAPVVQFDEPALVRNKADFPIFQEAAAVLVEGVTATTALYTYFGDISGISDRFFGLPFQILGLDFVVGSANFQLLSGFPGTKALGLGIIDARNTRMETVEEIVGHVRRVGQWVPPERIYVNPNCGLEFLPRDNAYRKLVRMVEGVARAREVLK